MITLKHVIIAVFIGFMSIMVFMAFAEIKELSPKSEIILLPYGVEEDYFVYIGENEYQHVHEAGAWKQVDNGLQTQNDPIDFIMKEDFIVFYTNREVEKVHILEGKGRIQYITDTEFIFIADVELPDYLVLNIDY